MADIGKVVEGQRVTYTAESPRALAWMQQVFQSNVVECDVSDPHGQAMAVSFETHANAMEPPMTFQTFP